MNPRKPWTSQHDLSARLNGGQRLTREAQPSVISHEGYREPTAKQLRYINLLASKAGRKVPKVKTRQGVQATIRALQSHIDAQVVSVPPHQDRRATSADRPSG